MKKINVLAATAIVALGIAATSCDSKPSANLKSAVDSASYAIGVSTGAGYKENLKTLPGGEANIDALIAGFVQAIKGDSTKMTPEQAQTYLNTYFVEAQARESQKAKEEGEKFLAENKTKEGVITTESGLQYKVEKEGTEIELWIKGLLGGHSGSDIHKQRGNAVKLSSRMYIHLSKTFAMDLISIDGGEKDNVITYSAKMKVLVDSAQAEEFITAVRKEEAIWKKEFSNDETGLNIEITNAGQKNIAVIAPADSSRIMKFIYAVPQGLICSDRNLPGQSETSLNLGVTVTREDSVFMQFLLRSSIETKKQSLCERVGALVELAGGRYIIDSEYPAWGYDPNSKLRPLMRDVYVKMFEEEPRVEAVHTGLECGIFGGHCEGLDSVSFGPNILDIHSINEKLDLASVERMWRFLLEVLKACK